MNEAAVIDLKALSLLVLLTGSTGLGLFMGWRYLRQQRNRPVHIAIHLVLGFAGLECMAMLRRGAPDGTVVAAEGLGNAAGLLLVLAVLSGLLAPILGRHFGRRPGSATLLAHATAGLGGFVLFVAWVLVAW